MTTIQITNIVVACWAAFGVAIGGTLGLVKKQNVADLFMGACFGFFSGPCFWVLEMELSREGKPHERPAVIVPTLLIILTPWVTVLVMPLVSS